MSATSIFEAPRLPHYGVPCSVAAAVRDVHVRGTDPDTGRPECRHCDEPWPCPTIAAVTHALTQT